MSEAREICYAYSVPRNTLLWEYFNKKYSLLVSEILKQCTGRLASFGEYLINIIKYLIKIIEDHKFLKPGNKRHAHLLIFFRYNDHLQGAFFCVLKHFIGDSSYSFSSYASEWKLGLEIVPLVLLGLWALNKHNYVCVWGNYICIS